jgi:hypothetical protein
MRALDLEFLEECLRARIITLEEFLEAVESDAVVYPDIAINGTQDPEAKRHENIE